MIVCARAALDPALPIRPAAAIIITCESTRRIISSLPEANTITRAPRPVFRRVDGMCRKVSRFDGHNRSANGRKGPGGAKITRDTERHTYPVDGSQLQGETDLARNRCVPVAGDLMSMLAVRPSILLAFF